MLLVEEKEVEDIHLCGFYYCHGELSCLNLFCPRKRWVSWCSGVGSTKRSWFRLFLTVDGFFGRMMNNATHHNHNNTCHGESFVVAVIIVIFAALPSLDVDLVTSRRHTDN